MRTQLANVLAVVLLTLTAVVPGPVRAADPELPPGLDPGGTAIAIISTGLDYTDPKIASRLARDGEGQLIGWDFIDNDVLPYAADPTATSLAKLLLDTYAAARLVVVRVAPDNAGHLAQAAAFVARTPAKIAAVPHASPNRETWVPFARVVQGATNTLFILSAGIGSESSANTPTWPAGFGLKNALTAAPSKFYPATAERTRGEDQESHSVDAWVTSSGATMFPGLVDGPPDTSAQAVALLAAAAACASHGKNFSNVQSMRALLLATAQSDPNNPSLRVHDPMCWYGGIRQ